MLAGNVPVEWNFLVCVRCSEHYWTDTEKKKNHKSRDTVVYYCLFQQSWMCLATAMIHDCSHVRFVFLDYYIAIELIAAKFAASGGFCWCPASASATPRDVVEHQCWGWDQWDVSYYSVTSELLLQLLSTHPFSWCWNNAILFGKRFTSVNVKTKLPVM